MFNYLVKIAISVVSTFGLWELFFRALLVPIPLQTILMALFMLAVFGLLIGLARNYLSILLVVLYSAMQAILGMQNGAGFEYIIQSSVSVVFAVTLASALMVHSVKAVYDLLVFIIKFTVIACIAAELGNWLLHQRAAPNIIQDTLPGITLAYAILRITNFKDSVFLKKWIYPYYIWVLISYLLNSVIYGYSDSQAKSIILTFGIYFGLLILATYFRYFKKKDVAGGSFFAIPTFTFLLGFLIITAVAPLIFDLALEVRAGSSMNRLSVGIIMIERILLSPWLGYGLGSSVQQFDIEELRGSECAERCEYGSHSGLLSFIFENGFLGSLFLSIIMTLVFLRKLLVKKISPIGSVEIIGKRFVPWYLLLFVICIWVMQNVVYTNAIPNSESGYIDQLPLFLSLTVYLLKLYAINHIVLPKPRRQV